MIPSTRKRWNGQAADGGDVSVETTAYPDDESLAEGACSLALARINDGLRARGRAVIVLAGGNTPRETYRLLARAITEQKVPAHRLAWLFGDERWVPVQDPQSNERMARECLLDPIGAPASTVISWDAGRGEPVDCAARYALKAGEAMAGDLADLVFLGMGADGHTASLFPDGTVHLSDGKSVAVGPDIHGYAVAVSSATAGGWRLTLCPGTLSASRTVMFLVSGNEKAAALRRAREGDHATPAAWIRGNTTLFLVTRGALGPEAADFGRDIRHA